MIIPALCVAVLAVLATQNPKLEGFSNYNVVSASGMFKLSEFMKNGVFQGPNSQEGFIRFMKTVRDWCVQQKPDDYVYVNTALGGGAVDGSLMISAGSALRIVEAYMSILATSYDVQFKRFTQDVKNRLDSAYQSILSTFSNVFDENPGMMAFLAIAEEIANGYPGYNVSSGCVATPSRYKAACTPGHYKSVFQGGDGRPGSPQNGSFALKTCATGTSTCIKYPKTQGEHTTYSPVPKDTPEILNPKMIYDNLPSETPVWFVTRNQNEPISTRSPEITQMAYPDTVAPYPSATQVPKISLSPFNGVITGFTNIPLKR